MCLKIAKIARIIYIVIFSIFLRGATDVRIHREVNAMITSLNNPSQHLLETKLKTVL